MTEWDGKTEYPEIGQKVEFCKHCGTDYEHVNNWSDGDELVMVYKPKTMAPLFWNESKQSASNLNKAHIRPLKTEEDRKLEEMAFELYRDTTGDYYEGTECDDEDAYSWCRSAIGCGYRKQGEAVSVVDALAEAGRNPKVISVTLYFKENFIITRKPKGE